MKIIYIFIFLVSSLFAQFNPIDGYTILELRANNNIALSGAEVLTWTDNAQNVLFSRRGVGNMPDYITTGTNAPYLDFENGTTDALVTASALDTDLKLESIQGFNGNVGTFDFYADLTEDPSVTSFLFIISDSLDFVDYLSCYTNVSGITTLRYKSGGSNYNEFIPDEDQTGWHLYTMTWTQAPDNYNIYLDGVLKGTEAALTDWTGGDDGFLMLIGWDNTTLETDHNISDFRLSNKVRTTTEMLAYKNWIESGRPTTKNNEWAGWPVFPE